MPTTHPRLNITLGPHATGILVSMAKQEHKSVSSVAKELILEALERREDVVLSALAKIRDTENHEVLAHDEAWE